MPLVAFAGPLDGSDRLLVKLSLALHRVLEDQKKTTRERGRKREVSTQVMVYLAQRRGSIYMVPLCPSRHPGERFQFHTRYHTPRPASCHWLVGSVRSSRYYSSSFEKTPTHTHPHTVSFREPPSKTSNPSKGSHGPDTHGRVVTTFPREKADVFSMANRLARATLRKKTHK